MRDLAKELGLDLGQGVHEQEQELDTETKVEQESKQEKLKEEPSKQELNPQQVMEKKETWMWSRGMMKKESRTRIIVSLQVGSQQVQVGSQQVQVVQTSSGEILLVTCEPGQQVEGEE